MYKSSNNLHVSVDAQLVYLGIMSMLLHAKNVGTLLDVVLQITSATVHALVGQTS